MRFSELGGGEFSDAPDDFVDHPQVWQTRERQLIDYGEAPFASPRELRRPRDESPEALVEIEPSEGEVAEVAESAPEIAKEETEAFLDDTARAFIKLGIRTAAHAVGLGPAYEMYSVISKVVDAAEALTSDKGGDVSVPVPLPVDHLDFMAKLHFGESDSEESHLPVTFHVAPGEDSLAAAVELEPEREQSGRSEAIATDGLPESAPEVRDVTAPDSSTVGEHARRCHRIAVLPLDLGELRNYPPQNQAVIVRNFAEQQLRAFLAEAPETRDLNWLVGIDPELRLMFWTRITRDPSAVWRTVVGIDAVEQRLVFGELVPGKFLTSEAQEVPSEEDDAEERRIRIARAYSEQFSQLVSELNASISSLKRTGSGQLDSGLDELQSQLAVAHKAIEAHDQILNSRQAALLREEFHRTYDDSLLEIRRAIEELRLDSRLEREHEERIRQVRRERGLTGDISDLAGSVARVIHHVSYATANHGLIAAEDEAEFRLSLKSALETVESLNSDSKTEANNGFASFANGSFGVWQGMGSPNMMQDQTILGPSLAMTLAPEAEERKTEVNLIMIDAGEERRQSDNSPGGDSSQAPRTVGREAQPPASQVLPRPDGSVTTDSTDRAGRVTGAVIVGWPAPAQFSVLTTDELVQQALALIFENVDDGTPESAALAMKAVRRLQVIVIFDSAMQKGIWIEVDPATQRPAVVLGLLLGASDGGTRSAQFLRYTA